MERGAILPGIIISDLAADGAGVGRHEGQVVFVPGAVPGDVADVKVISGKKKFLTAGAIRFVTQSSLRTDPFCEHFGTCGGCRWQHVQYAHQLEFKRKIVQDAFARIGKVEIPPVAPVLPSPSDRHFRNKLEFTFSARGWVEDKAGLPPDAVSFLPALGFHIRQYWHRVLDIRQCHLQSDPSNDIRLAVKEFAVQNGLSFYDLRAEKGLLRNLIVRTTTIGEVMVVVSFHEEDNPAISRLMDFLAKRFPAITSLHYVINRGGNDSLRGLPVLTWSGRGYIMEQLGDMKFRVGPQSFFQTNTAQAHMLYRKVKDFAQLTGAETVYDLYSGAGTIACFVADACKKVIGIEQVAEAVTDAEENARLNGIANVHFIAGDVRDTLAAAPMDEWGKPDVVITDPARAGMHEKVVSQLLELAPERIVYVSCNPSTQARDAALLDSRYAIEALQPVDMFPHTPHVENVALFRNRN